MNDRARMNRLNIPKEPIREDVRESLRPNKKEVIGRDGKALSRKRGGNVDRFEIPAHLIPDGWDYNWKRETVLGQEDTSHVVAMAENGWRPVDAERHEGYFMPVGYTGPIRRDGMILMERPLELTEEARAEEKYLADSAMRSQREQLGLQLPRGFSNDHAGVRPRINRSYEPADVARPRLAIED